MFRLNRNQDYNHPWNVSPAEARQIQEKLRDRITFTPLSSNVDTVAGADVSFNRGSNLVYAAVVVLKFPDMTLLEKTEMVEKVDFPYIPGLLSFREGPPVLNAWRKLKIKPDVIIFDGQGIAHPRRFGLASHLGVILDVPSIGCAKTVLIGKYEDPGKNRGNSSLLMDDNDVLGMAVRTRSNVKPVFVSIGHRVDLPSAVNLVLKCANGYRLPEPTRIAHLAVNALRRGETFS